MFYVNLVFEYYFRTKDEILLSEVVSFDLNLETRLHTFNLGTLATTNSRQFCYYTLYYIYTIYVDVKKAAFVVSMQLGEHGTWHGLDGLSSGGLSFGKQCGLSCVLVLLAFLNDAEGCQTFATSH